MTFTIMACTDIAGKKVNIEFPLPEAPTSLLDLFRLFEQVFDGEASSVEARSSAGGHAEQRKAPFAVMRVQRYEDDREAWTNVTDVCQLQAYDQLYVYRKNLTKSDVSPERELPMPRHSPFFQMPTNGVVKVVSVTPTLSEPQKSVPIRSNGVVKNGDPPRTSYTQLEDYEDINANVLQSRDSPSVERCTQEQLEFLFGVGDASRRGYLNLHDFKSIFRASEIHLGPDEAEAIHHSFAKERRGEPVMLPHNFYQYGANFPQTVSVAYGRLRQAERQKCFLHEQRENTTIVENLRRQKEALEKQLDEVKRQLASEQDRLAWMQNEAEELKRSVGTSYREREQLLLDKEVSVFQYRQKLRQEQIVYERLAEERRRRGSSMPHDP